MARSDAVDLSLLGQLLVDLGDVIGARFVVTEEKDGTGYRLKASGQRKQYVGLGLTLPLSLDSATGWVGPGQGETPYAAVVLRGVGNLRLFLDTDGDLMLLSVCDVSKLPQQSSHELFADVKNASDVFGVISPAMVKTWMRGRVSKDWVLHV